MAPEPASPPATTKPGLDPATKMASHRTGLSFQRTRLAADRTLMAEIRTSLSLISFGFTISQVFQRLREADVITQAAAPRNFGLALVLLGITLLLLGIAYHAQFMLSLRSERRMMSEAGLIPSNGRFPVSVTLVTAILLLLIGVFAVVSMVFQIGPFG